MPKQRPSRPAAPPSLAPAKPPNQIDNIHNLPLSEWLPDQFSRAREVPIVQSSHIYNKNEPTEKAFSAALMAMYVPEGLNAFSKGDQPTPGPLIQLNRATGGIRPSSAAHEAGHAIWGMERDALPLEKLLAWRGLHKANPEAAPVQKYPDDASHSFADAISYYITKPEQLIKEAPEMYNFLRDLFGFEYKRQQGAK